MAEVTVLPAGPTLGFPSEEPLCSYQAPGEDKQWVPIPEEESLQRAWLDAAAGPRGLQLQCRVSRGQGRGRGRGTLRGGGGPSSQCPA